MMPRLAGENSDILSRIRHQEDLIDPNGQQLEEDSFPLPAQTGKLVSKSLEIAGTTEKENENNQE